VSLFKRSLASHLATYLCTSDPKLNLAFGSAHQLAELVANTFQKTQSVVLSQRWEEILDSAALVGAAGVFLELGNDLGLVIGLKSGRTDQTLKLGIRLQDLGEGGNGAGGRIELGLFGSSGVL
jgi:hypothetical protein